MIKKLATVFSLLAVTGFAGAALADGDPAKGEKIFKKCKACHAVGDSAKNKVGPMLNGIIDATAGSVEGFKYSKAMLAKKEEGLVWSVDALDAYLTKPKDFVPKTKMTFAGLKKEQQRADIIAYLKSFE